VQAFQSTTSRILVLPARPTADDGITVCILDAVYPNAVVVERNGARISVTILDSGFSWLPNPPVVVSEQIGILPPGSYIVDARVDAGFTPRPPGYPRLVAGTAAFDVTEGVAIPLGGGWLLAALSTALGAAALGSLRRRRASQPHSS
jgi:hypothetical protein